MSRLLWLVPAAGAVGSPLAFRFTPTGTLADLQSSDPTLYGQVTAGFAAAGAFWSGRFRDDITINVTIDFPALALGLAGVTDIRYEGVAYADIRAALALDRTSSDDGTAVAGLPTGDRLSFLTNNTTTGGLEIDDNGSVNNLALLVSRANMKALGFVAPGFLEPHDAGLDASILFSSGIDWDFDPSDGIGSGMIDFVGVAIHEVGHAMGFVSGVDTVDYATAVDSTSRLTGWTPKTPTSRSTAASRPWLSSLPVSSMARAGRPATGRTTSGWESWIPPSVSAKGRTPRRSMSVRSTPSAMTSSPRSTRPARAVRSPSLAASSACSNDDVGGGDRDAVAGLSVSLAGW